MKPAMYASALADLRPYHLPDPVSWWPPAPGWWGLALLLSIALGATVWAVLRRHWRRAALRSALRELDALVAARATRDGAGHARNLSRLLRRYALTRYPRQDVAGLAGDAWLQFLDRRGGGDVFTRGVGRRLGEDSYRPAGDEPAPAELDRLVRDWILKNAERAA